MEQLTSSYIPLPPMGARLDIPPLGILSANKIPTTSFSVAALYCKKLGSKIKDDIDHYVHIGTKMFGSGGFSNAIGVSETGVAKFPKIAPGSDGFGKGLLSRPDHRTTYMPGRSKHSE
ncbi:uncharacterized protein LAJ45_08781 [Morchella importuna]|uniref:uncharacterized protein n=1 Tax=Morchella importuna TaxID=1174673 RepID=UPI001E8DB3A4|nr:uncharacterized protein LAJ45_08781 [Morchella importuna]KAH8147303.1 hypothetical protein LAJ45_08781 [Morchella importuna]